MFNLFLSPQERTGKIKKWFTWYLTANKNNFRCLVNDLEIIYEELVHVKALSHLSSLVKRELAAVLLFEIYPYQNTISNYLIILNSFNNLEIIIKKIFSFYSF